MAWGEILGQVIGSASDVGQEYLKGESAEKIAKETRKTETAKAEAIGGQTWMFIGIGAIIFIALVAWALVRKKR